MEKQKTAIEDIVQEDLDLGGLILPFFDEKAAWERVKKGGKRREAYRKMHEAEYGDEWLTKYMEEEGTIQKIDYDFGMKCVNSAIHRREWVRMGGNTLNAFTAIQRQEQRMYDLFGNDCDIYNSFLQSDLDIDGILLQDALKSGKWKELPDELQPEYHRMAGEKHERI